MLRLALKMKRFEAELCPVLSHVTLIPANNLDFTRGKERKLSARYKTGSLPEEGCFIGVKTKCSSICMLGSPLVTSMSLCVRHIQCQREIK